MQYYRIYVRLKSPAEDRGQRRDAAGAVAEAGLNRSPVIRFLLIVETANASNMRCVAVLLRPLNPFPLCFECSQCVVGVILNSVVVNTGACGGHPWVGPLHKLSPYSQLLIWNAKLPGPLRSRS